MIVIDEFQISGEIESWINRTYSCEAEKSVGFILFDGLWALGHICEIVAERLSTGAMLGEQE